MPYRPTAEEALKGMGKVRFDAVMARPTMKINRPPQLGKFVKVAEKVAVPLEKMVM
jgi:hypothetical protein